MAFVLSDRIKETTTTTGTGTYTLGGAVSGFETFTANLSNGDTTYYCCTDGTDFEVGLGTFASSGTTLARTTIISSSNSNNAVSWSSGTRDIFCTLPGSKALALNGDNSVTLTSNTSNPVIGITGGGPNFIRFFDNTSSTNAVDIIYRTNPNDLLIERSNGNNIAEFGGDDGHAALYFDDSKKLETTSGGVTITGTLTGNVTGDVTGDVTGNVSGTAATVTGAAQSNITSVGTLTGLTTSGTINLSQISGTAIKTTGNLASADLGVLRASTASDGTHGFTIKYMGSRTGNNNSFSLFMDNQTGTDVEAITVLQDGKVGINQTTPTASLHVGDTALFDDDVTFTGANGNIVFDKSDDALEFADNVKAVFGTGGDLQIYHDGSKSIIHDNGTGQLKVQTSRLAVNASNGSEKLIDATENGSVELYHDNSKKVETTSTGATVSGKLDAGVLEGEGGVTYDPPGSSGSDTSTAVGLALHSGARIVLGTGGYIRTIVDATANSALKFGQSGTGYFAGTEIYGGNSGVKLHHSSTNILETKSTGVDVNGDLTLTSTDAGASAAPTLSLYRNSASPASSDDVGQIQFFAENDADEKVEYARIDVRNSGVTDGGEYGQMDFMYKNSGSDIVAFRLSFGLAQFYNDLYIGSPYKIRFEGSAYNNFETDLAVAGPTADRTITLPDATGTVITTGNMNSITDIGIQQYDIQLGTGADLIFEGATSNANETTLTVTDPTADRTVTLPDATGTVLTTGNSDTPSTTTSSSDADFVLVDDGGTMKKITPSNLGITSGGASKGFAVAMAIAL